MVWKLLLVVIGVSMGGFMLADGVRNLVTGTYFGSGLGPWSALISAAHLDPHHFGAAFLVLGLGWLAGLLGALPRTSWGWWLALASAVLSLWYLPVGTTLAVVYTGLLVWRRAELTPAAGP